MKLSVKKLFKSDSQYDIKREPLRLLLALLVLLPLFAIIYSLFVSAIFFQLKLVFGVSLIVGIVLWILLSKTGATRVISLIAVFYVNFLIMPVYIYYGNMTSAGTPIWITGGIILVFLVLDGRDCWWVLIVTVYYETLLYINFYVWDKREVQHGSEVAYFIGFAAAFIAIGVSVVLVLLMQEHNFKLYERAIDESREIENSAGVAKSRFLANMSHEIRTPMNSIIGLSELMLKDEMDDRTRNAVTQIKQSAYDLLDIIDDVLVFSKIDSGKLKLMEVDFEFENLIKQILDAANPVGFAKDLKFHVEIDHSIPKVLHGDDIRIKQILMRLIFISLSHTDNGRIIIKAWCERKGDIATVKFMISDTGMGLSEADLDAVYGVYEVYDSKQNSNLKGIGLKLNICHELLNDMKGSIEVRSIEEIGLQTKIEFDCGIVDDTPMIEVEDADKKRVLLYVMDNRELSYRKAIMEGFKILPDYVSTYFAFDKALQNNPYDYIFVPEEVFPSVSHIINTYKVEEITYVISYNDKAYGDFDKCRVIYHPISSLNVADVLNNKWKKEDYAFKENVSYDGSKAKILVVDDNSVNLKVAKGIFGTYNIDIDIAKSGEEAINKMLSTDYHLVLMDLIMPEMNGVEALKKIRSYDKPSMKEVPVIALTATTGGNIREEILEQGFQEYIAKPIKQRYLLKCLEEFLPPGILKKSAAKAQVSEKPTELKNMPNTLDTSKGLANIGYNENSYCAILNTYYSEGLRKIKALPESLEAGNISLFTTDVHGIKSSSASIGAMTVSAMFKELENAGKENNTDYIGKKYDDYIEAFKKILGDVKEYLLSKSKFEYKEEATGPSEDKERESLPADLVASLKGFVDRMDLKACDAIFADIAERNYGAKINDSVAKMRKAYDMFDFHAVKEELTHLSELAQS